MSNLIIKGMEMPKHAVRNGTDDTMYRSCVLVHPDGTAELVVDLEYADKFNFEHSLKRFPIIEIPTPHGELIDRDDLLYEINRVTFVESYDYNTAYDSVAQAETVVEAEQEE